MQKILINVSWLLGLLFSYAVSASPPDRLYVFGDSLSDNGNLATLQQYDFLNHPPYAHGFSNGPRAVEVLAAQLALPLKPRYTFGCALGTPCELGTNYAFAGARAYDTGPTPRAPNLSEQVGLFLLDTYGAADPQALYIVFIGGNDLRDARNARSEADARNLIRLAVNAVGNNVRTLLKAGAQTVMVVNSGDLGAAPETRALAVVKHQPSLIRRSTELTRKFNEALAESVHEIKEELHAGHLVAFDYFSFSRYLLQEYVALGFTDNQGACFSSVTFTFYAGCNNGANFDQFVFFDEIHISARIHERLGRAFYAVIPELAR